MSAYGLRITHLLKSKTSGSNTTFDCRLFKKSRTTEMLHLKQNVRIRNPYVHIIIQTIKNKTIGFMFRN